MTEASAQVDSFEESVAALYSGPLEDFIRQRDILAKSYRSAGNRVVADTVRGFRKPSRHAWALNVVVSSNRRVFADFDGAVTDSVRAHGTGGDVRASMTGLRAAVRELAETAASAAERAGHRVEASAMTTAILAVLGSSESYAQLRSGRLVEVPAGGGLDALISLPAPSAIGLPTGTASDAPVPEQQPDLRAARERVRRAADHVVEARSRADSVTQILHAVRAELAAAEQRVREAERELDAARRRHENARRDADAANAELQAAEALHKDAQRRLDQNG